MIDTKILMSAFKNKIYYEDDFIVLNGFNIENFKSFPQKLDMVVLGICTEGESKIKIEDRIITFTQQQIAFIPEGIKSNIEFTTNDFNGYFFLLSKKFCKEVLFVNMPDLINIFVEIHQRIVFNLSKTEFHTFINYYHLINEIVIGPNSIFTKEILRHLFTSLALKLYSLIHTCSKKKESIKKSRHDIIVEELLSNINRNFKKERKVEYYAQLQFLTPKYLSLVSKTNTGHTVSEWINLFVINEAKSQLRDTDKTIQEIAIDLNFNNQSFFGKYFKLYAGMSPSEYRKSL